MKKVLASLLALALILTLLGCSAKSEAPGDSNGSQSTGSAVMDGAGWDSSAAGEEMGMPETPAEEPMEEEIAETVEAGEASPAPDPESGETISVDAEKIIYTAYLALETTKFDEAVAAVESLIAESGGYIQSSNVRGDTRYNSDGSTSVVNRFAYYTVAVPSKGLEDFLGASGGIGNVTSQSLDGQNITSSYTDTEARIESLRVQEERLLAMLEESSDLESLIQLEQRLSEVTYEIESYQRQLDNWDRQVAYSTVTLELSEVEAYTPTAAVTRSFGEKLGDALSDGLSSFVRFLQNFALFVAESLPGLLLLAAVVIGIVFGVRRRRRRRAEKKAKNTTPPPQPPENP